MKKQYLLLTFALAFLPLYSMESTQESANTQFNTYIASDIFEENFLKDLTESTEHAAETIKDLNQCFETLSDENATKIQTIIKKLSDNQQKAIFQKLLEQEEWNAAVANAIWCDKTNGQWTALIEPFLNQKNIAALQSLITLVSDENPLQIKINLVISLQPLLDNEQWKEAAQWILKNINDEKQSSTLTPYLNQLISNKNFDALQILQSSFSEGDFLYDHIQLAINDTFQEQSINHSNNSDSFIDQTMQNLNSNNSNNNNSRMENDNVSTQPIVHVSNENNSNENNINKNQQTATIETSDGKRDLNSATFKLLKNESITIANFVADFEEQEHLNIPLEQITSEQLNLIVPFLKTIHENKTKSDEELKQLITKQLREKPSDKQELTGKEGKQEEETTTTEYSVEKLITLFKTADYLEAPILLDCCIELLAEKLITSDELKQFIENPDYFSKLDLPEELSNAIATKISPSRWTKIAGKLDYEKLVNSVIFSPNGRLVATASYKAVYLYTIDEHNTANPISLLTTLDGYENTVKSVAFSPNSRLLATASDKTVYIYAINEQNSITLLTTLQNNIRVVNSIAFSPNGCLLATASDDEIVYLYTINEKNKVTFLKTLNENKGIVYSLAFSLDSRLLAIASGNEIVDLYTIDDQKSTPLLKKTLNENKGIVYSLAFSLNGRLLATASYKTVCLYAIDDQNKITLLKTLENHNSWGKSVAFNPSSRLLATTSRYKDVCLYVIDEQNTTNPITLLRTLKNHIQQVNSVAFSPNGRLLATASDDTTVNIYNLTPNKDFRLEQLLLLLFLFKDDNNNKHQPINLKEHPHLQSIFDSLPETIKNKLIEKNLVKAPWSDYLNYSWNILKTVCKINN